MELLDAGRSVLVVIDLQGKLMEVIHRPPMVVEATRRLMKLAEMFEVPVVLTEQYPKGLGPTHPEVMAAFEAGPFADRQPHRVEAPFALVLAGQVVRGRIDAVYAEPDGSFLVVDWKTGRAGTADPLQLAIYRLAWAELHGLPPERVRAAFHHVRSGETVVHDDLPDRPALERLIAP